jgi:hypothetical protein
MPYLPSRPGDAVLLEVLRAYPGPPRPLLGYLGPRPEGSVSEGARRVSGEPQT